eukprot:6537238-Ditylum_brightwellii.AAC.1
MVHDVVAKLPNHVLKEKGLNPSITADVESLDVVDFTNHIELIIEKDDEVSIAIRDMCKILAVSYYSLLGVQKDSGVWDPNNMASYNDITKVYVAAVQHHKEQYKCSTDVTTLSPTDQNATTKSSTEKLWLMLISNQK